MKGQGVKKMETQMLQSEEDTHFMCPFYVNFSKNRSQSLYGSEGQLISVIPLHSKSKHAKFWIQRGVSILCYIDAIDDKV